jgi:membrane-associated phospholipid phosphatase
MLTGSLLTGCPSLVVQSAQFLGGHVLSSGATLFVVWIFFVTLLWRTIDRRADDIRDGMIIVVQRLSCWAPIQFVAKRYPRSFSQVALRFFPKGGLGLHLTIGLAVMLVATLTFLVIAGQVGGQDWLSTFDHAFSASLHARSSRSGFLIFSRVSQLGSPAILGIVLIAAAISLGLFRQWSLLAGLVTAMLGGLVLDSSLKHVFQRVGPRLDNPWIAEAGWSFPSGHAIASVVVYGFVAYLLLLVLKRPSQRVLVIAGFLTMVIAIGFSRIYIGAHYFSDVLAGYVVGVAWLTACVTGCEVARNGRNIFGQQSSGIEPDVDSRVESGARQRSNNGLTSRK